MLRLSAALVLILVAGACANRPADVVVERMDVVVTVLDDGMAQVEERLVVRFGATPSTTFRRHSPVWRHDGITDVSGATAGGQFQAEPGNALAALWTFPATASSTRVFTLTYRARNVVAISGIRGTVSWLAIPATRDFDVSAASVAVNLPGSAVLLQDPWVEEAGWAVTRQPQGLGATRSNLTRTESATAGIEFTIDHMTAAKPTWQFDAEQSDQFMPAFVSAGLFILVVGAGVVGMLWFKYRPAMVPAADPERLASARDLRTTAWVVLVSGILAWGFVATRMPHFGVWPLAIPLSMLVVGVLFLVAATRMLYFARVRDGRTSV